MIIFREQYLKRYFIEPKNLIISRILYICTPFYDNRLEKGFLRANKRIISLCVNIVNNLINKKIQKHFQHV
jgi:hypothetical protein